MRMKSRGGFKTRSYAYVKSEDLRRVAGGLRETERRDQSATTLGDESLGRLLRLSERREASSSAVRGPWSRPAM